MPIGLGRSSTNESFRDQPGNAETHGDIEHNRPFATFVTLRRSPDSLESLG